MLTCYVISIAEYREGKEDYDRQTLTYFAGDDVLCDESQGHIPEQDAIVGEENLTRFGDGSNDNNVVYVRNDAIQRDFEILHSAGNYEQEVLGLPKAPLLASDICYIHFHGLCIYC